MFHLFRVSIKFILESAGETQGFLLKIFVSKCQENWQGKPSVLSFRKIPLAKKFMDMRGVSIKIFRRKFFVSKCRISCKVSFKCSASVFSCSEKVHG